jgi:DNA polymerase-3 subunit delta
LTSERLPVALVWGESDFLVREAALALFAPATPQVIDATDWRPGAIADLAAPSLFGEDRALLLTSAEDLPDDGLAEVARHSADPPPHTRLVLAAVVGPRAKGPPRALAQALGKGAEIRRAAVDRRELPNWVRARARSLGLTVAAPGPAALIETVGEDPAILDQALRQVASVGPPGGLTREAVAAQFRGFGERRVWELCDAAFGGDAPRALRTLAGLLEAREEPLMVLGGIASRLRDLMRVRSLPPGMPQKDVARAAGLRFDWQARRYLEQARRFSVEDLAALHADVVEADGAMKQGGAGQVVLALVVTRIAARARAPAPGPAGAAMAGGRMRARRG